MPALSSAVAADARVALAYATLVGRSEHAPLRQWVGFGVWRLLRWSLYTGGVVLAVGAGWLAGGLWAATGGSAADVASAASLIGLAAGGLLVLRNSVSERRTAVSAPPERVLLAAVDVTRLHVWLVRCVRPALTTFAVLVVFLAALGSAGGLRPGQAAAVAALVLGAFLAVALVDALWGLSRPTVRRRGPMHLHPVIGAAALGLGWGVTVWLRGGPDVLPGTVPAVGLTVNPWPVLAADGLLLAGFLALVPALRRRGYDAGPARPAPVAAGAGIASRTRSRVSHSAVLPFLRSTGRLVAVLGLAGAGCWLGGGLGDEITPVAWSVVRGYAFISAIVVVGLFFSVAGPSASVAHLRYEWEISGRSMASVVLGTLRALPTLVGREWLCLAVGTGLFVSAWSALALVLLLVLVVGAALIGEAMEGGEQGVDGRTNQGTISSVCVLALSVPFFALSSGPWGVAVLFVYACTVLAVGVSVAVRRTRGVPWRG